MSTVKIELYTSNIVKPVSSLSLPTSTLTLESSRISINQYNPDDLFEAVNDWLFETDSCYHAVKRASRMIMAQPKQCQSKFKKLVVSHPYSEKLFHFLKHCADSKRQLITMGLLLDEHTRNSLAGHLISGYFIVDSFDGDQIETVMSVLLTWLIDQKQTVRQIASSQASIGSVIRKIAQCSRFEEGALFSKFCLSLLTHCSQVKPRELRQLILTIDQSIPFLYLCKAIPSIMAILTTNVVQGLRKDNFLQFLRGKSVRNLRRQAIRQWIAMNNNLAEAIDTVYFANHSSRNVEIPNRKLLHKIGNSLDPNVYFESLVVRKYLRHLLQNKPMNLYDEILWGKDKESGELLQDVVRALEGHKRKDNFTLILLNEKMAPSDWRRSDIFAADIHPQLLPLKAQYESALAEFNTVNKNIVLAFSTFVVELDGQTRTMTFAELNHELTKRDCFGLRNTQSVPQSVAAIYPLLIPKKKEEPKVIDKKHYAIVVEAKILRAIKRNKEGLNERELIEKIGFPEEDVKAALKKLENKGMIELSEKNAKWEFLP